MNSNQGSEFGTLLYLVRTWDIQIVSSECLKHTSFSDLDSQSLRKIIKQNTFLLLCIAKII